MTIEEAIAIVNAKRGRGRPSAEVSNQLKAAKAFLASSPLPANKANTVPTIPPPASDSVASW